MRIFVLEEKSRETSGRSNIMRHAGKDNDPKEEKVD